MIVFHGTGGYNLPFSGLPIKRSRHYLKGRKAFCVTTDFQAATLFAIRQTTSDDFLAGKITGVVLEFELSGICDKDYTRARDDRTLRNESEIAVFNVCKLKLVAMWTFDKEWKRK